MRTMPIAGMRGRWYIIESDEERRDTMNIYQKILKELERNPQTDVFTVEERLGTEAALHAREEARKKSERAARFPSLETYPYLAYKRKIEALAGVTADIPPDEVDADFAIACFALPQGKKMSPAAFAQEIAEKIQNAALPFVAEIVAQGGYVNVTLRDDELARDTLALVAELKEWYGASREGGRRTVIIEYASPNAAKPMSVGHMRSALIGESLKRLYAFQGYGVIGINHFGDFGTQFGKLLAAEARWKDAAAFEKDPIKEMLRLYVKFHEEAKKDETLEDSARALFKKLEEGDSVLVKKWAEFCAISVADFQHIYDALGVAIEVTLGESFYQRRLAGVIERCLEKKIAARNEDGSAAVYLEEEKLPSYLLQKKDGSSLYATRDIAAAEFRVETFKPEKIIYVVGGEQTLYFRQVFATLARLGYGRDIFQHDSFGLISLPEGKMSTREGRVIFLEDLLQEAQERSLAIVSEKNPACGDAEKKEIAAAVGIGAVIYNDLSQSRERDIVFDWKRALSMEGSSAPYIQYGYARAMSIIKKAGEELSAEAAVNIKITTPHEAQLVRRIARFPEVVAQCTKNDHPHILAGYLNALTQDFNRFYREDAVLSAEGGARTTRLLLVSATAQIIKNGLRLLGIKTLERM